MPLLKLLTNIFLTLTSLAYPLIWLFFPNQTSLFTVLPFVMGILWAIKTIFSQGGQRLVNITITLILFIIGINRSIETLHWYPVLINSTMLLFFGGSLLTKQPIIERLARLTYPNFPIEGVIYTKKVTQVWCLFFIFNGGITAYFILTEQFYWWAMYSGVISYILMGLLFAIEWIIRQKVMKTIAK